MHSLISPLCMYWAPACIGCLAVKVLLFIHPFTMHGLNAYCLLGTGLCPRLQQGIGQSVSDFMELSFAFLLLYHYTGPSQQPLGRGYFHFLFTNEHSEGWSRWVICSGWAVKTGARISSPKCCTVNEPRPSSRASDGSLLPLAENTHAPCRCNAARAGGPGRMEENLLFWQPLQLWPKITITECGSQATR